MNTAAAVVIRGSQMACAHLTGPCQGSFSHGRHPLELTLLVFSLFFTTPSGIPLPLSVPRVFHSSLCPALGSSARSVPKPLASCWSLLWALPVSDTLTLNLEHFFPVPSLLLNPSNFCLFTFCLFHKIHPSEASSPLPFFCIFLLLSYILLEHLTESKKNLNSKTKQNKTKQKLNSNYSFIGYVNLNKYLEPF